MGNLIDKKVLVTGLVILVIAFFARKAFVKVFKNADGSEKTLVGFDGQYI